MKKLVTLVYLLCTFLQVMADEWTDDNGVTWYYTPSSSGYSASITGASQNSGDLVIPSKVNGKKVAYIAYRAFRNYKQLTSVIIPEYVTGIGKEAFKGCTGLKSVTFGKAVKTIESDAFEECYYLERVYISSDIQGIDRVFGYDDEEGDVPETTLSLFFSPDVNLTTALHFWGGTYGSFHVKVFLYIDDIAEKCNKSIPPITWECAAWVGEEPVGVGLLDMEGNLVTRLDIPYGVTSIADNAFRNCSCLESVSIPSSVTSIGNSSFLSCWDLKTVSIQDGLQNIADSVFYDCYYLTDVSIPSSVTSIGLAAFSNYPMFETINVSVSDYAAFCSNLVIGQIKNRVNKPVTLIDGEGNEITEFEIPEGVETIGVDAFNNCTGLISVTIPSSVTNIGNNVFSGCVELKTVYSCLSSPISIDASVFPDRDKQILYVPYGCRNAYLIADYWNDFKQIMEIGTESGEMWTFNVDGPNAIITGKIPMATGDITIPSVVYLNGTAYNVTGVANSAFYDNSLITNVTIPESVTSIGSSAFSGCSEISSVTLPGGLMAIGENAFEGCNNLNSVYCYIMNPLGIGSSTFANYANATLYVPVGCKDAYVNADYWGDFGTIKEMVSEPESIWTFTVSGSNATITGCTELTADLVIPSQVYEDGIAYNVTAIGASAFKDKSVLESVTIPEGVTSIGSKAFYNCYRITSLTFPKSLKTIGSSAFAYCTRLTEVTLPEGLTNINSSAFNKCTGMTSVTISSTVTSIGSSAFSGCNALTSVYCYIETPLPITENTFSCYDTAILYVPAASKSAYISADYWSGFYIINVIGNVEDEPDTDYSAIDNTVYLEPVQGVAGGQVTLSVKMKNTVEVQGFQFDLVLPEGVTVATDEDGLPMAQLSTARTTKQKTDYFNCSFREDRSLRVLCGSLNGFTFNGNDGEVALVKVNIAEDLEEGDYPVILREVSLSDPNSVEYDTPYLKSTLSVSPYSMGDVNGDTRVNVSDFISTGSYILGRPITPFIFQAADINGDNQIKVGDFIGIGNIILHSSATAGANGTSMSPAPRRTSEVPTDIDALENALYVEPLTSAPGTQAVLSVRLKNAVPIAGFECNLQLPDGISVATDGDGLLMAVLSEERTTSTKTNFFGSSMQSDGSLKVLCGTNNGTDDGLFTFSGNNGEVARITVDIPADYEEGEYAVTVANGVLSDANASSVYLGHELAVQNAYLTVSNSALGIDDSPFTFDDAQSGAYYTIDGQKINGKPSKKGVYITEGKKVVVK